MPHRHLPLATAFLALTLLTACAHPRLVSSGCRATPSSATWTPTRQPGLVEAQVRDLKEDAPIGNLEVVLDGGELRRRTDAEGMFRFTDVPEGRHVLTTNATVYLAHGDTIVLAPQGGVRGTIYLTLPKDVLKDCELYHP